MTTNRALLYLIGSITVLLLAVLVTIGATVRAMRPLPPDLANPNNWSIEDVLVSEGGAEVKVYSFRVDSTDWNPYDIRQNKILVRESSTSPVHEFLWPSTNEYAGTWCEIIQTGERDFAIVLSENEYVVRVVRYSDGRFLYRHDKDELLSSCPLAYAEGTAEKGTFAASCQDSSAEWVWSPSTGFRGDDGAYPTPTSTSGSALGTEVSQ